MNGIKDQIISFPTAKLAKDKGFDLACQMRYNEAGELTGTKMGMHGNPNNYDGSYSAPTQSSLRNWLIEKHWKIIDISFRTHSQSYCFEVKGKYQEGDNGVLFSAPYSKYAKFEEALEAGLQESLKLI